MLEEMQRLREESPLRQLLEHYVDHTSEDKETWLDRCMALEGVESKRLSELHGLLIAFGWVEQNSGQVAGPGLAVCAATYRTTAAGRRAAKQSRSAADDDSPALAA